MALQFRTLMPHPCPSGKKVCFTLSWMLIDASHIARKHIGPPIFVRFCMYMCEGKGVHAGEGKIKELARICKSLAGV